MSRSCQPGAISGFGADIGFEKFWNLKCRFSGLTASVSVIAAHIETVRKYRPRRSATSYTPRATSSGLGRGGGPWCNFAKEPDLSLNVKEDSDVSPSSPRR
jgi:hypothetical protein